ncbi:MAG: tRNA lysidine(34) synthetase TilS [Candidatus Cloacimonetes bacterium]|nr:tRNA lysidine(34) synthetase TilS [Candidatus Cloacimonadota bacterium]
MAESHTDLNRVYSKLREKTFSKTFPIAGKVFLLSLSGGADSVFLFHFLVFLNLNYHCTFEAIHFNHQLRDQESDEDVDFCKNLCKKHGVKLTVHNLKFKSVANLQEDARNSRYKILKEKMSGQSCYLLTGHHGSDSIESFLIGFHQGRLDSRILKLQSVLSVHNILRPLVHYDKKSILDFLDKNGFKYRSDSSNEAIKYLRNYYRHSSLSKSTDCISNIQSYLTNVEKQKVILFSQIPYQSEEGVLRVIKNDMDCMSKSLKREFFYYLHQKFYARFMRKLDMKRVDSLLNTNRFGKKIFHVSSHHQETLNIIEYSKKYEFVIV